MTIVREMLPEDLESVADLEKRSFSVPWSAETIQEAAESRLDRVWVLMSEGKVAGYCDFRIVAGEGELMRIAVEPSSRGQGFGRKLLETLTETAARNGVDEIALEVRVSNQRAIALYKSFGFRIEAVRKRYYTNPVEDAFIMWRRQD